jgi:hypothetical protein
MYKHDDGANRTCTTFSENISDNFMLIIPAVLICNKDYFKHRPTQQVYIMYILYTLAVFNGF